MRPKYIKEIRLRYKEIKSVQRNENRVRVRQIERVLKRQKKKQQFIIDFQPFFWEFLL